MSEPDGRGGMIGMSACIVHRGLFAFDPDRVPSVLWDHRTKVSTEHALQRYASEHLALHGGQACPPECENGRREIEDRRCASRSAPPAPGASTSPAPPSASR